MLLAALALPALPRNHLPITPRTNARSIFLRDESSTVERDDVQALINFADIVGATDGRRHSIAPSPSKAHPVIMRRRMHSVAARLPERAGMCDDIAFVMNVPCGVFLDTRELAGRSRRPLRSRLAGNLFEIIELALYPVDPGQQLALRSLGSVFELMSQLDEARFEAAGLFKCTDALSQLAKTTIQVGNTLELIDLTLHAVDPGQ